MIGRDRELDELWLLLADPGVVLVTLIGTGGSGKTTLALELARQLRPEFPEGATVVRLASITEHRQVVPEMARVLGVELSATEPALVTITRALRSERRLLLLDNFEHVLAAAPAVAQLLAECPHLKVLVTSRAPLRVSFERAYHLSGLALPGTDEAGSTDTVRRCAAGALFIERATATDPTFELTAANAASVADLCHYLGGLPLALELAAARAAVLSPAAILERLRTSSEPLGPRRRDAPERHRTLHATIDWTYQLLTPAEQTLFAQLGLFVGGFTAHSAEAVCAGVGHSVVDGLASLLDHSLIHPVSTPRDRRLAMLEPIRDYALGCVVQDAGHDDATLRHAKHYVAVAEAAEAGLRSSDQLQWLDTLDDEQANLRAVLQRANSQPQLDLALRIAGALRDYWVTRDLVPEIRAWLSHALAKPPGAHATRARALLALGVAACEDAAWTQATPALEQCLGMCPELNDVTLTALSEAELAYSERNQGRIQQSAACSERALVLARETEDPWTHAHVLFLAASCARDYETARELELEALALFHWLGDRIWPPLVESNLGYRATVAGDFREARVTLEQAIIDADAVWGAGLKAQIQGNLGLLDLLEDRVLWPAADRSLTSA